MQMGKKLTNEAETELKRSIENLHRLRIAHTGWKDILDEVDDLIDYARSLNEPGGLMIVGESGAGKSTLLETIRDRYPVPELREDCTLVPCPIISIPSRPTIKSVGQATLLALGDPLWNVKGQYVAELKERIACLTKGCESRALLFDEANHFVDGRRSDSLSQIADWLKELSNSCKIPFIMCGLPRSEAILNFNVQLHRRFNATMELSLIDNSSENVSLTTFNKVVKAISAHDPILSRSGLLDGDFTSRLFVASDGRIGLLVKLLGTALKIAVRRDQIVIDTSAFERSFQRSIWRGAVGKLNPFNPEFKVRRLNKPGEPYAGTTMDPATRGKKS